MTKLSLVLFHFFFLSVVSQLKRPAQDQRRKTRYRTTRISFTVEGGLNCTIKMCFSNITCGRLVCSESSIVEKRNCIINDKRREIHVVQCSSAKKSTNDKGDFTL